MGGAIGQVLVTAVGVAISPLPIVAVVLILLSSRGRVTGPIFVAGWLVGLVLVGTIVLTVAGGVGATNQGKPATWVSALKLVLGVLLLLAGVRQWRGRPEGSEEAPTPKWMGALDSVNTVKALSAGVFLSGVNPKNLLLTIAAASAIAQTGISSGQQVLVYAIFVAIATIGVGAPVVLYFALGDRSQDLLDRLKTWMARNNAAIMTVLFLLFGVKLIGDAISGFTA
jgi:threonine/homoserine/homoserine lactone efflux protein